MASTELGPYEVGEIPADLVITFTDSSGTALDLSGGYEARFVTSDPSGTENTTTVTVSTPATGEVTVSWANDAIAIDAAGIWEAELWVGNGTNRLASKHFWFYARAPIEAPAI